MSASEEKKGEAEKEAVDEIGDELTDTVAYSLIDDAWRLLKINDIERKYFQTKYREVYEVVHGLKKQEELVMNTSRKEHLQVMIDPLTH